MAKTAAKTGPKKKRAKASKLPKVPRTHKPPEMSLEEWQTALRRQFGREQKFQLEKPAGGELFGTYRVTNPESRHTYRVLIRGYDPGLNHCTCPDFTVNTLGTCKHVEFTLGRIERRSGTKSMLRAGYQPPYSEVYLRYGTDRQVCLRVGTDAPADLARGVSKFVDNNLCVKPEAFDRFDDLLDRLRMGGHEVVCRDDAMEFVAQSRDGKQLQRHVDELFPGGVDDPFWKTIVSADLYAYQRAGALFMARAGRSLLADDMGLGKTVQSIAAAEILARVGGVERVLVVTPTSLKHQWKLEIDRFTTRTAVVVEGPIEARRSRYAAESFFKITNYETLHLDTALIGAWAPDLIILDEAQRIKNWKTRTAQTVKELKSQHAIVLTGTPLENRLEELYSIVQFVDRYRLGPSFRFLNDHQSLDENGRVIGYKNLGSITQTLKPVMLRRTKGEVLKQLPGRIEKHFYLATTSQQKEVHEENRLTVARIVNRWRRKKFLSDAEQRILTSALQNMRMSCNSTYLLDPETDHGTKIEEMMARLDEMLETAGTKVVIFSQWVRSHELLAAKLTAKKIGFVLLHGGIPGVKRPALVERFKNDPNCRVFLSTDAGGVGLNLQHASVVFNMDQPWNPAILEQRIGRVHRLGQHRPVRVMHFVAKDTIEHGMLDLIRFKRSLFTGVLDGTEDSVSMGGTRLNKFMEGVEAATTSIPATDVTDASPIKIPPPQVPSAQPTPVTTVAAESVPAEVPAGELFSSLLELGKVMFDRWSKPSSAAAGGNGGGTPAFFKVEPDPLTGRPSLRIPMPSPSTIQQIGSLVQQFLNQFGQRK